MENKFELIDIDEFVKNTEAKQFTIVMEATTQSFVYTTNGWRSADASWNDWPYSDELLTKENLKVRYLDIATESRYDPVLGNGTKLIVQEKSSQ